MAINYMELKFNLKQSIKRNQISSKNIKYYIAIRNKHFYTKLEYYSTPENE